MRSSIIERPATLLAGFDFFGDPFRSHGGWNEENEIGRLWQRWMAYLAQAPAALQSSAREAGAMYEVHVYHPETPQTGEFEVFVGLEIDRAEDLPPAVVAKALPAGRYAVFTLEGQEIVADWTWQLDQVWLPALGVRRQTGFSIQRYDARFKGLQDVDASELDVLVPLLATSED